MRRAMARAVKHIEFVVSVYREQRENADTFSTSTRPVPPAGS